MPLPAASASSPPYISNTNCSAGLLQVDLISSAELSSELNASNPFASNAQTYFLEPVSSGGKTSVVFSAAADQPEYVSGCFSVNQPNCTFSITSLNDPIYYLRVLDFYNTTENLTITASDGAGNSVPLQNAQILIDSTGYASGQYKRLQERVCYGSYCGSTAAAGALQSTDCIDKQFSVYPGDPLNIPSEANLTGCT
jgi:hypothetical protein